MLRLFYGRINDSVIKVLGTKLIVFNYHIYQRKVNIVNCLIFLFSNNIYSNNTNNFRNRSNPLSCFYL